MASQHSTTADFSSRYKFNSLVPTTVGRKELDKETGWYYYGARYYDPQVSTWLSVDPLAEKYIGFSPYNYTADNSVMLIDFDGKIIVFPKNTPLSFKIAFAKAVAYLYQHGAGDMITKLAQSSKTYYVAPAVEADFFDGNTMTIGWDPNSGLETNELQQMSPAAILNHEIDHALQFDKHKEKSINDSHKTIPNYDNEEEKRVITGSEQSTAKKLGELNGGGVTRKDHRGHFYKTKSPTSTEAVNTVIINAKKKHKKKQVNKPIKNIKR